jgi:hypothetical protein
LLRNIGMLSAQKDHRSGSDNTRQRQLFAGNPYTEPSSSQI